MPKYTKAVEEWFGPHKEHKVVKQARRLRATVGVSYDAVASNAIASLWAPYRGIATSP